jgi:hypothetical protein
MGERTPVRDPREPPADSPALVHREDLFAARAYLDRLRVHHLDLTRRFMEADGNLYSIDLVMAAVMSRSYSLVEGFSSAFDGWNLIVAAPLLRIQLDSLTRLSYMARAPRADEVAEYVISGGEFRKLKDAEGRRLGDRRLIEHARDAHPWVEDVYEATSGWVHFSPVHVVATLQVTGDSEKGRTLSGGIPIRPEQIPVSMLKEVLGAMIRATEEIFGYVEAWESRKGLPSGEVRDITRKRPESERPLQEPDKGG